MPSRAPYLTQPAAPLAMQPYVPAKLVEPGSVTRTDGGSIAHSVGAASGNWTGLARCRPPCARPYCCAAQRYLLPRAA
eukprot:2378155-Pyramimonas_sp.AAC.1